MKIPMVEYQKDLLCLGIYLRGYLLLLAKQLFLVLVINEYAVNQLIFIVNISL